MTTLVIILILCLIVILALTSCRIGEARSELASAKKSNNDLAYELSLFKGRADEHAKRYTNIHEHFKESQRGLNDAKARNQYQLTEIKELRDNLKELSDELGLRQKLKAIKFTANVPLCGWSKTEFKLGVGPCGLTVDHLKWVELDDHYVLTQYHSDGSRKEFEYLKDDIKGRIEKYLND